VLTIQVARYVAVSALSCLFGVKDGYTTALARPRVQFICLHHFPACARRQFRKLLSELASRHTFIGYSEAVRRIRDSEIDRPYIAFSSDDGFASDLMLAGILEEFGARACFFVCPSALDTPDYKRFCIERLKTAPGPLLDWNGVETLLARGHEIGSHTYRHSDLARIPVRAIEEEVFRARDILKTRCGAGGHFAWPFGRMRCFSRIAADIVFRAGHLSCASAIRGCHVNGWPRTNGRIYLWRDPLEPYWPIHHSLYFLANNSRRAACSVQAIGAEHAAA
jgi:hypothetical protein